MRPLPISLQARMNFRGLCSKWLGKTDMNTDMVNYGDTHTLPVPIVKRSISVGDTIATRTVNLFFERRIATPVDAFIEGVSATGIPVLSQVAGGLGIVWGVTKGFKAAFKLAGEVFSFMTATQTTGWARTGLSAIKSTALGISTFFPPVGVLANAASAGLSGFNASVYLFVEPLTRASAKDIPELMSKLSQNPRDDRLKILLGSIGTAIVPAIETILKNVETSVELKRTLLNVLRYDLRYKRGESVSDLCPLVRFVLSGANDYRLEDLEHYVYADGGKNKKIFEAIVMAANDDDEQVRASAKRMIERIERIEKKHHV